MQQVLVTGGAGYLGSVLVEALLTDGYRVQVLDNFMHRQTSLNAFCSHPGFAVTVGDARDSRVLLPLLKVADIVIPLAAIVGAPACDADKPAALTTNLEAVGLIVKMIGDTQTIVIPITNSGYGIGEPGKECTEASPLRPISYYGKLKVNAEQWVLERENSISLRLATVFGMSPRMRLDLLVNDFVNRAQVERAIVLFEAHFKRNYIHVRDVASAFLHTIDNFDRLKGNAFNVGLSDANLSKLELCKRIADHVDFTYIESQIGEDPDKRDYIVSNAKIEATGFRPSYSIDDGIAELLKGLPMLRAREHRNA